MRQKFAVVLVVLLALVGLSGCSSNSSKPLIEQVKDAGVLVVGTEGTYSPFSYQGADGQLTGFDIDVVRAVGSKLGVKIEFVQTPFDSIFAGLQSKRFDLIANQVTVNADRQAKYDLSTPYNVSQGEILTRSDNTTIKSLADLAGKTTAQSSTSTWSDVAKKAGANVEAVEGFVQAVTLVKDGRVDALVNDSLAIAEYQKQTADPGVKVAAQTGDTSVQAFAARKNSGLMDAVNAALAGLQSDGTLAQISQKYFGTDIATAGLQAPAPTAGAVAAAPTKTKLILDNLLPLLKATVTVTIPLTALSFVIGLALALVIALARISSIKPLSLLARFYVSIVRALPFCCSCSSFSTPCLSSESRYRRSPRR